MSCASRRATARCLAAAFWKMAARVTVDTASLARGVTNEAGKRERAAAASGAARRARARADDASVVAGRARARAADMDIIACGPRNTRSAV